MCSPAVALGPFKKPTVAVRFCPVRFALRALAGLDAAGPASLLALPYRWIYAVVAHDAVFLYDTQQPEPLAVLSNLHYSAFTDAAWCVPLWPPGVGFVRALTRGQSVRAVHNTHRALDASALLLTSRDGYCSLVRFEPTELGERLPPLAASPPNAGPVAVDSAPELLTSTPTPAPAAGSAPVPASTAGPAAAVAADQNTRPAAAVPASGPAEAKPRKRIAPQLISGVQ